jgi:predicted nucleic-acid-binding protein
VIGLDTNVLVRYLTLDDSRQAARAVALIDGAAESGEPLFISTVVLCELVWVLDRAYGYPKPDLVTAVEGLLRAAQLRFVEPARLWAALADFRDGRADFADCVIGREGADAGCDTTMTFDRTLADHDAFSRPPTPHRP